LSPYEPQNQPKVGKLVSLQRIVQGVGSAPDLPAASRIVVKRIRETMHTDVAFLVTLEAQLAGVITLARASGAVELFAPKQRQYQTYVDAIAGAPGVALGVGIVAYAPMPMPSHSPSAVWNTPGWFRSTGRASTWCWVHCRIPL